MDILKKHPEITLFSHDRKVMSESVLRHRKRAAGLPKYGKLQTFNRVFSALDDFSPKTIEALRMLPPACQFLRRALTSYPVPRQLRNTEAGRILDLHAATDEELLRFKLMRFIDEVESLPEPADISVKLSPMGHIPLISLTDPLLEGKVGSIRTFDITGNPGLSIKDIMARQMIEDALKTGILSKHKIIVEGTSGNTGIGLTIVAAAYGLKTILVIPDKMSPEKIERLARAGAHVVVTPTKVSSDSPFSYYSVRDFIADKADGWKASQYDNLSNRKAHELVSGPEIWEQTEGKVTAVIATAGTCGTVSGIGSFLKKKNQNIKIFAVDTVGSILYLLHEGYRLKDIQRFAASYTLQGFGEDIHPENLDPAVIDRFIRISDADGLYMTRYLPYLGFVGGQSSGAAYAALWKLAEENAVTESDHVVTIFPDTGIPYRKDAFNDSWIRKNGFGNIIY